VNAPRAEALAELERPRLLERLASLPPGKTILYASSATGAVDIVLADG
jgi:hypothetical protein